MQHWSTVQAAFTSTGSCQWLLLLLVAYGGTGSTAGVLPSHQPDTRQERPRANRSSCCTGWPVLVRAIVARATDRVSKVSLATEVHLVWSGGVGAWQTSLCTKVGLRWHLSQLQVAMSRLISPCFGVDHFRWLTSARSSSSPRLACEQCGRLQR